MSDPTKQSEPEAHHAPAPSRRAWYKIGTPAAVSLMSAIGLGAVGLAHSIRNAFYHSIVRGFNESPTICSDVVKKYTDRETGVFAQNLERLKSGEITGLEHLKLNRKTAGEFNQEVASLLTKHYDIPTFGFEGWTIGTWKRFNALSTQGRITSSITFASLVATAVGAVFVLKNGVDRAEDARDESRAR